MYYLKKTMEVSASHFLHLPYDSKCKNLHGHNYIITVYCKSEYLNENGMVVDFTHIKEVVDEFDHNHINTILYFSMYKINPTAENMAKYILQHIENCYRVEVEETKGNIATYVEED